MKPTRAYSYLRFSDRVQRKGDSGRRQTEFAERICEKNGWILDDSLTLHDLGVSAYRGKNARVGALSDFLDAVESGRIEPGSALVIENIDRLSRSKVGVAFQLFVELLNRGVIVVTAEPERIYTQESINDVAGLLEPIFYMSRAHEESRMKSMRVGAAWKQRKDRARTQGEPHTRMTPAWIEVGPDGKFRMIPERARAIREIFRLAREGHGSTLIVRELAADPETYPPFGKTLRWNRGYVEQILRNKAVYGEHQQYAVDPETGEKNPQGEPVREFFPAAVTEEEFWAARAAIEGRSKRGGGRTPEGDLNLLHGLVTDAVENSPMYLRSVTPSSGLKKDGGRKSRRRRYRYLVSKKFHEGEKQGGKEGGKWSRSIDYDAIEEVVLATLSELTSADLVPAGKGEDRRSAIETGIRETEDLLTGLAGKLEAFGARAMDLATPAAALPVLLEMIEKIAEDRKRTVERLERLKTELAGGDPGDALGEVRSFVRMLAEVPADQRPKIRRRLRGRLRSLIAEIRLVIEKTGYNRRAAHVRIRLASGVERHAVVHCPEPRPGEDPATSDLAEVDFRTFHERIQAADDTVPSQESPSLSPAPDSPAGRKRKRT